MCHSDEMVLNCPKCLFNEIKILKPNLITKQWKYDTSILEKEVSEGELIEKGESQLGKMTMYKYYYVYKTRKY